jgi:response regulator RpfG family c-di-GMP phosphodiesterase
MEKASLLILDDEKEVLNALNRVLRKYFQLYLFSDANEALGFYEDNPHIPLVITDMRMPIMDGATFLGKIIDINPSCKRFLLTGHADVKLTMTAVNEGKISHYFAKPWDNQELITELTNAYELHQNEKKTQQLLKVNLAKNAELSLINSSLELETNQNQKKLQQISSREANSFVRLKKTFSTFIDIYAETIRLHTKDNTGHNLRVACHARLIAEQHVCSKLTIFQIYIAGLLYETGKIALDQQLLKKPLDEMNQQEKTLYNGFYYKSYSLLKNVEQLAFVAEIIKNIPQSVNKIEQCGNPIEHEIPLGSRIIAVVSSYDNLINGRQFATTLSTTEAKHRLRELAKSVLDPFVVNQYLSLLVERPCSAEGKVDFLLNTCDLDEGMILTKDILNSDKHPLLTKGTQLEQHHIDKLLEIEKTKNERFLIYAH